MTKVYVAQLTGGVAVICGESRGGEDDDKSKF